MTMVLLAARADEEGTELNCTVEVNGSKIQNVINPHPSQAARVIIEEIFQYKLFLSDLLHIWMIFIFLNQFR